jgi:hypothetical protein
MVQIFARFLVQSTRTQQQKVTVEALDWHSSIAVLTYLYLYLYQYLYKLERVSCLFYIDSLIYI